MVPPLISSLLYRLVTLCVTCALLQVFSRDASGTVTYGSEESLRTAINQGRRVRVVIGGTETKAFEPENVLVGDVGGYIGAIKSRVTVPEPLDKRRVGFIGHPIYKNAPLPLNFWATIKTQTW